MPSLIPLVVLQQHQLASTLAWETRSPRRLTAALTDALPLTSKPVVPASARSLQACPIQVSHPSGSFWHVGPRFVLWPGYVERDDNCLETSSATQRADDTVNSDEVVRAESQRCHQCRSASALMPTRAGTRGLRPCPPHLLTAHMSNHDVKFQDKMPE
ncbi:hypothetical protein CDEST_00218 [Colletotrichum destructivum]|uniref:Uncharacterized protein n=1 Tax=Colletotrichum destructivum TaxID=34406 RepID=A0AAX4HWR9_9PEZI|nr:hypothetical protein CDEST_00218 [Colletotrichum destructivum]